ncbi:hypothetical protein ABBQ32_010233 [Trebouxia sp. C0010 RCD-2024]
MPLEYNAAFVKHLQCLTQEYLDRLERCVRDIDDPEAVSIAETGKECLDMLKQQQEVWQQVIGGDEGNVDNAMSPSDKDCSMTHQAAAEEQSKISRVAAMGGTPALGAGMVLPKLCQHQLQNLSSTESPAARELHAAQNRPDEPALTPPPPSVTTPNNSPPWLIELRKRQGNSRPSSPPKQ